MKSPDECALDDGLGVRMTVYYENIESRCGRELVRLQPTTGLLETGKMYVVQAPPGHGKSSFQRMLAGRLQLEGGSRVYYNGLTREECVSQGLDCKQQSSYLEQSDFNLSVQSVEETFRFTRECMPHTSVKEVEREVEEMLVQLGLSHCRQTPVGDSVKRGVSGGERRRTSLGETQLCPSALILQDQFSDGLDSDAVRRILGLLREKCENESKTVVCVLQQCSPEMLEAFDTLIQQNQGYTVYHGPVSESAQYLADMGFPCPSDEELGDFIMDVQVQPRTVCASADAPQTAIAMREHFQSSKIGKALDARIMEYRTMGGAEYAGHFGMSRAITDPQVIETTNGLPPLVYGFKNSCILSSSRSSALGVQQRREGLLILRSRALLAQRLFKSIFVAGLCGSLLFNTQDSDYHLKCTVFLVSLTLLSFGSLAELPTAVAGSKTAIKHVQAGLFSSPAYVAASLLVMLPVLLIDCAIFMGCTYWMTNLVPHATEFFQSCFILYLHSIVMTVWFRYLASLVDNESVAQAIGAPMTGVWLVFSGFFTSDFKPIVEWLFWLSPFSWSYRALANVEFNSTRYDAIVLDEYLQPIRLGNLFMHALDISQGQEWIGYAILYTVAQCSVQWMQYTRTLDKQFHELVTGTRLSPSNNRGDLSALSLSSEDSISVPIELHDLQTLHSELPFEPVTVTFRDVGYTVPIKAGGVKQILQGVSGFMAPGQVTALMGASGSGKTTLLNQLSGRVQVGTREGQVKINKDGFTSKRIHRVSGYVEQFDSLFPSDSVEEALIFSAKSRLPAVTSTTLLEKVVDEVLQVLELSAVRTLTVGMLSPSQKKLTSIGIELVSNPSVLFLDEITTGLNSVAAETVMRIVKKVAAAGRTVIACVHQPSSKQFYYFDSLLQLAPGGTQVFFGSTGPRSQNLIEYQSKIPGALPLKAHRNPSNWMLEEVARFKRLQETGGENELQNHYLCSDQRKAKLRDLAEIETRLSSAPTKPTLRRSGLLAQLWLLQKRSFQFYFRNLPLLLSRILVLGVLSVLFGLVFYRVDLHSQPSAEAGIAVAFIPMIFGAFVHAASTLPQQFETRIVFYREKASGMYHPWLWPQVALVTETIWTSLTSLCMFLPYYFLSNLYSNTEAILQYWLTSFCTCICLVVTALLVHGISPNITIGGFLLSLQFAVYMLLSGIFVSQPNIPDLWQPLYHALPFSHLAQAAIMSQFKHCSISLSACPSIISVEGFDIIVVPAYEYIAHRMGFTYNYFYESIGWSALYTCIAFLVTVILAEKLTFMTK